MTNFDINNCTVQEACDYAIKQLVKQGRTCSRRPDCVYGNAIGQHCGIGWLLDPNDPDLMSYTGSIEEIIEAQLPVPKIITENARLFSALQDVHDAAVEGGLSIDMAIKILAGHGIDVSGAHWQQWRKIVGNLETTWIIEVNDG